MGPAGASILEMIIEQTLDNKGKLNRTTLVLGLLSGIIALISVTFFSVAFYSWLLESHAPPIAALIAACAYLAVSLLGFAVAVRVSREKQHQRNEIHTNLVQTVIDVASDIESELEEPVRESPKTALFLAALSGFVLAEKSLKN